MKRKGDLGKHTIRRPKPKIAEVSESSQAKQKSTKKKGNVPKHQVVEDSDGSALVVYIDLPLVVRCLYYSLTKI